MTDRLTDQQKHDLLERAKELAVTIHEEMEWPLDNAVQGAIDDTTDDRSVHSTVNSTRESRTAVDSFLSDNESKIREHVRRNSDGEFITRTASALTQTQRNHLTNRETMILCADCGFDLSNGTGSLTHETSACPMCGHQVFETYSLEKRFGPGTWENEQYEEAR